MLRIGDRFYNEEAEKWEQVTDYDGDKDIRDVNFYLQRDQVFMMLDPIEACVRFPANAKGGANNVR